MTAKTGRRRAVPAAKTHTLGEAIEAHRKDRGLSLARDKMFVELRDRLGHWPVDGVPSEEVFAWAENGVGGKLGPASIVKRLKMAHAAQMTAWRMGWRDRPVGYVMPVIEHQRTRWLSEEECEKLLLNAQEWLWPILVFMLNTGIRPVELERLRWEHVRQETDGSVSASVWHRKGKTRTVKWRTIPLNPRAVAALIEGGRLAGMASLKQRPFARRTGPVFHQPMRGPVRAASIGKHFEILVKRIGMEDTILYDLRRTFGSRLVNADVDLRQVADLLGHEDVNMTRRVYAHILPSRHREAVNVGMI